MAEYTYVLYLTIDHEGQHDNEIIFLGSSVEPHNLYYKAITIQYKVKPEDVGILSVHRKIIAEWKELVKAELDICEEAAEESLDWYFEKCIFGTESLFNLLNSYLQDIDLQIVRNEEGLVKLEILS